jgi:hypothetical protein
MHHLCFVVLKMSHTFAMFAFEKSTQKFKTKVVLDIMLAVSYDES